MSVKVVFFASIREDLGTDSVELEIHEPLTIAGLITLLTASKPPEWFKVLTAENIRIAVNQTMISGESDVSNGDEVAFFPPVTGG